MSVNQAVHADPRLDIGMALSEFDFADEGFIGERVFPFLATDRQAAVFSRITREGQLRRADLKRSKSGTYNRDGFEAEDDNYACLEYGHEQPLDDSQRVFHQSEFDAAFWSTRIALRRVMQEHEIRVKEAIFDTAVWTGAPLTTAVGTAWDVVTADTKSDVLAAKEKVRSATGREPNVMILSIPIRNSLLKNDLILDAIKYTARTDMATILAALADFYGLQAILVGKAVFNSADEGLAFTGSDVWPDDQVQIASVCGVGAPIVEPCVGRTFQWTGDTPQIGGLVTEQYREEQTRSWIYRARHNVAEKVIGAEWAHRLTGVKT